MLIERSQLAEIIATEVRRRLRELAEESDDSKGKGRRPKKPTTTDAEDSPSPKGEVTSGPRAASDDLGDAPESPDQDVSDDEGIDQGGNSGEEPSGAVNNEVSGKSIQALTIEPQSKILPGAKEVVISFNDSTDSLRILVTAAGQVKFFWRNQLHDLP